MLTSAYRIMEIVPGGKLIDKITTYDEYLESYEIARKRQTYTVQEEDNLIAVKCIKRSLP